MAATNPQPNEEDYIVRNPKEIIQLINALIEDRINIRVAFNEGKEDYITNIISVDTENGHLYLDMTVDEIFNKRMLNSQSLTIIKDDGIRIKWKCALHTQIALSGGKALRMEIPEEVIRLQRRELFRLNTPIVKPLTCHIPIPNLINPNKMDNVTYHLVDVSLGGIGLIVPNAVHPAIEIGKQFDDCRVDFPNIGEARLTLEVRNIVQKATDGTKKFRVGMEYVRPTRANENMVHRYTYDLERAILVARNK